MNEAPKKHNDYNSLSSVSLHWNVEINVYEQDFCLFS